MTTQPRTLGSWLAEGPFTLSMSAGFFGFYAHCGFLSALEAAGHAPSRLTGSSAGALVAGAWAGGVDAGALRETLLGLRRADFWDPGVGLGLLRGRRFAALLEALLPETRFEATRAPVALSVYDVWRRETRALRAGSLVDGIRASCALPGLFQPVWVEGRPLLDGGIEDRCGFIGHEGEAPRVLYHHLASRSPWRGRDSPALDLPRAPNLVTLVIEALPRLGPFRLARGRAALEQAAAATRRALGAPIIDGVVRVDGASG